MAVAWSIIGLVTALIMLLQSVSGAPELDQDDTSFNDTMLQLEARLAVAQQMLVPGSGDEVVAQMNLGRPARRLRVSAIAAVVDGPEAAREVLRSIHVSSGAYPLTSDEMDLLADLDAVYAGDSAESTQREVEESLGWFGQLAVAASKPGDDPSPFLTQVRHQAVILMFTLSGVILGLGVLGLIGLIFLILIAVRMARSTHTHMINQLDAHDGVYAETFALWMVIFPLLLFGLSALSSSLWVVSLGFMISMVALLWPLRRGCRWTQVRVDIGWTAPACWFSECGRGFLGYAMGIPIVAIGLMMTVVLITLASPEGGSSSVGHPVVNDVAGSDWWGRVPVLMLAVVAAPVVEETMFRGVLYRHLRSATRFQRWGVSVVVSAILTGLIFAAIHPQGVLAIPVLASMGFALALAREWRGSLMVPIMMHALSNGITMTLLILMVGDLS